MTHRASEAGVPWNVVVTVHEHEFAAARKVLRRYGQIAPTTYHNVMVMLVEDPHAFLAEVGARIAAEPGLLNLISRLVPAHETFDFQTVEDFEARAQALVPGFAARLAGKRFHVRIHRRGFKHRIVSPDEERRLSEAVIAATGAAGSPAAIEFDDPDAIIAIETIGQRAGLSLWDRDELRRYPFLRID